MGPPPPGVPRRRRNRPSMRALEILRRARETAAAAALAAEEAAELIACSGHWGNFDISGSAPRPLAAVPGRQRPRSPLTNTEEFRGPQVRNFRAPSSGIEPELKRKRPHGYYARKRERRRLRLASEAAAAERVANPYYGPPEIPLESYDYQPEFFPDEYPPPQGFDIYGWPGVRGGFPHPAGPPFELYPVDRMLHPVDRRGAHADIDEYISRQRAFMRTPNERMHAELRAPQEARRFSAPLMPPEHWGPPVRSYDSRW